tara:strand:+ start:8782 stop:9096 length:315 start_codon:yes stop_codon:yes gene_type:complete
MELKQKYTEVRNKCRFDEWFIDNLTEMPYALSMSIMKQIEENAHKLPPDEWSQLIGGVVKGKTPFFYEIEYLRFKTKGKIYFLDILEISCDDYLDFINNNSVLI